MPDKTRCKKDKRLNAQSSKELMWSFSTSLSCNIDLVYIYNKTKENNTHFSSYFAIPKTSFCLSFSKSISDIFIADKLNIL